MKCEHLGQIVVNTDIVEAAFENSVVRCVRKYGPLRQKEVWVRTAGRRIGQIAFQRIIDSLVERELIVRQTTNRVNSFILRLREQHSVNRGDGIEPF